MQKLNVALFGLGTVGSGVYHIFTQKSKLLAERSGTCVQLVKVLDRSPQKKGKPRVPKRMLAKSPKEILNDRNIQCVIELIGGTTQARQLVKQALNAGKDVITANKALLAEHGEELFRIAKQHGRHIFFEASVAGGVPIIKNVSESLIANRIDTVYGILNGTSNYILSKMSRQGMSFRAALKLAQEKGYAENDPTLDIDGTDAAHKLAILASLVYGKQVPFKNLVYSGINHVSESDIAFADLLGYRIKLLAVAKKVGSSVEARVEPTLLPKDHILASVNGAFNAVYLRGDEIGDMLFYGRGAGSKPTASAVISDVVDWGKCYSGQRSWLPMPSSQKIKVSPISAHQARFYLRFNVTDKPGVLSKIAGVFGKYNVSISDLTQRERQSAPVPLIFLTHHVNETSVLKAVDQISRFKVVRGKPQILRLEE